MSIPRELPAELIAFIHLNVSSLEILEILLLLRRASDREWSAGCVSHELRIDAESAGRRLDQLMKSGLLMERVVISNIFYRYATRTSELSNLVDDLAEAYAKRRLQVMSTVYSRPSEHIQIFADAFRLRKE